MPNDKAQSSNECRMPNDTLVLAGNLGLWTFDWINYSTVQRVLKAEGRALRPPALTNQTDFSGGDKPHPYEKENTIDYSRCKYLCHLLFPLTPDFWLLTPADVTALLAP